MISANMYRRIDVVRMNVDGPCPVIEVEQHPLSWPANCLVISKRRLDEEAGTGYRWVTQGDWHERVTDAEAKLLQVWAGRPG